MECWPELEFYSRISRQNPITDMNGVLQVRQQNAFLQNNVANVVNPNRQTILQTEFAQVIRAVEMKAATCSFFARQRDRIVIVESQRIGQMIPHYHAPKRSGEGSDQQTV